MDIYNVATCTCRKKQQQKKPVHITSQNMQTVAS